jgi:hypothetical protein
MPKTRQKHIYPSEADQLSYGRRSAAERANSMAKDPAPNDIVTGWCRLMGVGAMTVDAHVSVRGAQLARARFLRGPGTRKPKTVRKRAAAHDRQTRTADVRSRSGAAVSFKIALRIHGDRLSQLNVKVGRLHK